MSSEIIYELIGYTASILVVVSLSMSSIIKLRVLNLLGAVTFGVYGVLIGSTPIIVTNVVIAGLNVWYLIRVLRTREELTVIATDLSDPFVAEFLRCNQRDIARYRPGFDPDTSADAVFMMLRDTDLAGVFVGTDIGDGAMRIDLDYVATTYRDLRSGASLYGTNGSRFTERGWRTLSISDVHEGQRDYFARMRFVADESGVMERTFGSR